MVTFLPRISSTLTSFFLLRRSRWYSNGRLIPSRAFVPWNSRPSPPSGVTISITLAMTSLAMGTRPVLARALENPRDKHCIHIRSVSHRLSFNPYALSRPDHQPGDGNSGLQAQFRVSDFRGQAVFGQQRFNVRLRMGISAMRLEMLVGRRGDDTMLEGEDQEPSGP